MRLMGDRLAILVSFGLTESQARAYLVLLEYPVLNVGALAKALHHPRNRVYELVEQLQEMGLVEVLVDGTRKVRAKPITDFLDHTMGDLEARIDDIRGRRDVLALAFEPPTSADAKNLDAGTAQALLGRKGIAREIDRLVASASESLVLASSTGGCVRLANHLLQAPADVLSRCESGALDLEVFLPRDGIARGGVEELLERFGAKVCVLDVPLASILVLADLREGLMIHPIPDDHRMGVGGDKALLSSDAAFAADYLQLLRAASTPFQAHELLRR